jgi:glycosyltransferase involved in cell wall biosynthesis
MSVASRPYRVLLVSNFLPPQVVGGAELMAWEQLLGLARRGHNVCALAGEWQDLDLPAMPLAAKSPNVVRVAMSSKRRRPARDTGPHRQFEQAFERLLTTLQPEIVHFQNMSGLPLRLPRMARKRGAILVATLHDKWTFCPKSTLLRSDLSECEGSKSIACIRCLGKSSAFVTRQLQIAVRNRRIHSEFSTFDWLFAPSRHQFDSHVRAGYQPSRCRLLPYGIDLGRFNGARPPSPNPPGPLRLAYFGNMRPHKGARVLLDALALVPRERASLVMYGQIDSAERQQLDEWLAESELAGRVEHLGPLSPTEVPNAMAACDVVVVPSIWPETSSITGMEAMAAHRPVIASRIGGIPELIDDARNGFLVPPREPGPLADTIALLADDRARLAYLGTEAGRKAQEWSLEIHLDRLEALYADLVGQFRA